MVATVTGNSLGLAGVSASVLGARGQLGLAPLGQGGDAVYVNAKTGNLVIAQQDELIVGHGPDLGVLRTYNSKGGFDFDNGDAWQLSLYRKLANLTGTVNTVGSTIVRFGADGAQLTYAYDSSSGKYLNMDGGGAYDSLAYDSGTGSWTWVNGATQQQETYAAGATAGEWRITGASDLDGNALTYTYDNVSGLISQVSDASGDAVRLVYDGNQRLQRIETTASGVIQTRVRYTYDSASRLSTVSTDLSPADGSVADGNVFTTTYTYDGASPRIAAIASSDGTHVAFAYDASGRVSTITDGIGKVTTYTYVDASTTRITDPLGLSSTLTYDAAGNLTRLQGPAGSGLDVSYQYNANGDLLTLTDARGNAVSYQYNANGDLIRQQDAAGNVLEQTWNASNQRLSQTVYGTPDPDGSGPQTATQPQTTRYVYDAHQHLRFVLTPEGRVTEYRYDGNGQQIAQLAYVTGTYGNGATQAQETDLATWAAAQNLTAIERSDTSYDLRGMVSSVTRYGRTDASGAGIVDGTQSSTRYTYDAAGHLLQRIDPRGVATANDYLTAYAYDGMGRVISVTGYDAAGSAARQTATTYLDAGSQVQTTLANGLKRVSTYDARGLLISQVEQNGATTLSAATWQYDADGRLSISTDPLGNKTCFVYDSLGRQTGSIDATGALTETLYNNAGQVLRTVAYANPVTANLSTLFAAGAAGVIPNILVAAVRPAASVADQVVRRIYDAAGQLRFVIDGMGAVTENRYDGAGRLVSTTAYANTLNNAAGLDALGREPLPSDLQFVATPPAGGYGAQTGLLTDSANDRTVRSFYNNDGLLRGRLDAEGYLTEFRYDAAGQAIQSIRYVAPTDSARRTSGTLSDLLVSANTVPAGNITTHTYYNGLGQMVASVDGEGYLTTYAFDGSGNPVRTTRYANPVQGTLADGVVPQVVAVLPGSAPAGGLVVANAAQDRTTQTTWTAWNQLDSTVAADGTVTRNVYDAQGNLTRTVIADGTSEAGTSQIRYDLQGRVVQTLSPIGSAALAALGGTPTQAQIDALWTSYGTTYTYDAAGRRTRSQDANGNLSWFFYDADNRLTFTVRRVSDPANAGQWLGEVSERRYDTLGQASADIVYANRFGNAVVALLNGGADTALQAAKASMTDPLHDSQTCYAYDLDGRLTTSATALNAAENGVTTRSYNSFGDLQSVLTRLDASHTRTDRYAYDRRGLLSAETRDASGFNFQQTNTLDAFGRVIARTDARGVTSTTQYDRLGRSIQSTQASGSLNLLRRASFDAFDRVLSQTDANGTTTTYAYDTATRTTTTTLDAGGLNLITRTVLSRQGKTLTIVDPKGNETRFAYDANGNLLTQTRWDALTHAVTAVSTSAYDAVGILLLSTRDANGNVVAYTYDAAGRVLSQSVDPSGVNLTTRYAYDAQGNTVQVTDPRGVVTQTSFDRAGRTIAVTVDPAGLGLQTTYAYDLAGRELTLTEGAGSTTPRVTQYQYDSLGRRISETIDPSGLGLTTLYSYDASGNLIARVAAAATAMQSITRYTYDEANRLVYTVDALGEVTRHDYDAEGRVTQSTAYANIINLATLGAATASAAVTALLTPGSRDRVTRHAYDAAGRERFTIDALGAVSEQQYDAVGNLTQRIRYANPLVGSLAAGALPQIVGAAVAGAYVLAAAGADRSTRYTYDAFNRLATKTEAAGTLAARTESWGYDAAGNVLRHTDVRGNSEWFAFDSANRVVTHIDTLGYVTRSTYWADGKLRSETRCINAVALPGGQDDQWANHAATPLANPDIVSGDRLTSYAYDGAGRLQSRTDPVGAATTYTYDALGNVINTTVAAGTALAVTLHRAYDLAGRVVSETRAWGLAEASTTSYTYDAQGNQTSILTGVGTAGVRTTAQVFDILGRKIASTDGAGATTTTTYNAFGDIVKVVDARGNAGYFYTDALGRVTLQVDPEGALTETRYDLQDNVTDSIRYSNRLVGTPDLNTRPQIGASAPATGAYVLTGAADERQTTLLDVLGRKTEIRTWFGPGATDYYTERFTWDAAGNPLCSTARNGAVTTFEYDKANRKTREILPITGSNGSGASTPVENRFSYDALGNLTQRIEAWGLPEQRTTAYTFDKLNRQVKQTGDALNTFDPVSKTDVALVPTQTRTYDARGNLIEEIDARGGRTLHYYDAADRENGRIDAAGAYTVWTYDAVGNKLQQTAFSNAVKIVGGASLASLPAGTPPAIVGTPPALGAYVLLDAGNDRTTNYLYDAVGRAVGTRVDAMITGYYDTAAQIYRPAANSAITTQSFFDPAGNLIKRIDGNGNLTRSYYNRAGQSVAQLDAGGDLIVWTRDAYGNVTRETRYANPVSSSLTVTDSTTLATLLANTTPDAANDRITDLAYDNLNRVVLQTVHGVATGSVAANGALTQNTADAITRYRYDSLNNLTQRTDATGGITSWRYDAAGRRIEEQRPSYTDYLGATVSPTTDYEYNGLGSVTRQIERGTDNGSETDDHITRYTYGAGGFLASQTDAAGALTQYRTDANGNVTRRTLAGRINANGVSVSDVTLIQYDAMNRQRLSTDVATGTTQETRYNVYGQVTGKRTNGGGSDTPWTEFADYDQAGRIWRGNSGDGITKVWVFDKAGNATLKIDSPSADLSGLTLAQILALKSPVINQTVSVYDARNQLIDTIQPSMVGDGHQTILIQQTLIEQQGTSFAGVGNATLTQAAGLGVVGGTSVPTATGAVSIARAQTVSATMTDSYSYSYDSYGNGGITSAAHSLSVSLPDTSSLGSGNIRVHASLAAASGLAGGGGDVYVAANATSASLSFAESCWGQPGAGRAYSYALYKQTANGEICIGSYNGGVPPPVWGSQSTVSTTTAMGNIVNFSGQRPDAARLVLMTRPAGSNSGWTVTNVPARQVSGSNVPGWFALDWSSWNRGNYEYRYVALDGGNNVVNSEQGQMLLSDSAPQISQMAHSIGGAGRAFMDAAGAINFTEQGSNAQTLTVLYRHAGSNDTWSSQVLTTATVAGANTPGWFILNTVGLSGAYDYTIEAKNAAGVTLNKAGASFTAGNANSVQDPSGASALTNPTVSVGASAIGVTNVSGVHADNYTYDAAYNFILTSSDHTMNLNLPNTAAWGDGQVYVTTSMLGVSGDGVNSFGSLGGSGTSAWVPSGQSSVALNFSEATGYGGPVGARSYNYAIYKQTDNGLMYLGGSDYTGANPATSRMSSNIVAFSVQPNTASRVMMEYRKAGGNGGWSVMSVPPLSANGAVLAGRFGFDWTNWDRGAYEYRQVALDNNGNVLSTGSGTMNLQDGAPSISKTDDLIGGSGRVFMDTAGKLNFTEQGSAASSLTIRTRAAGSSGLWSIRQILAPASVGGIATPGWFQFDPASAGLTGNTEYVIEAKNASGQTLQKSAGSFVAGQANTVSALQGYLEPAPVARFNQPVSAQKMIMSWRPAGSSGAFTQASLPKSATGVFDWDTSKVFTSDRSTANYEYQYETSDANGVLVNKAHGVITLGSTPAIVSHVNDSLPTLLSFMPPAGNAIAATATQMVLQYRSSGSGAFSSTTLSRSDLAKPFVFDASALIPPGSSGAIDYSFTLKDAGGNTLKAADNTDLNVSGTVQVGTAADASALTAVVSGSTGPTVSLIHRQQSSNAFGNVVSESDGLGNVTRLSYNTLGKLVLKQDPTTSVTLANGYQQRQSPTTAYIYDLTGNLIALRDANGNLTTQALLPGQNGQNDTQATAEYHADGGRQQTAYDIFGNARTRLDEIGRRSDYRYDAMRRLTRLDRPLEAAGSRAWDTYAYDAAGNRISHSTTPDGSTIYTDKTDYDSLGRITATTSALGRRTAISYLWNSHIVGIASRQVGGWLKTTTDAIGRSETSESDQFGRTTRHTDLGGHTYVYLYNNDGWLTSQSNSAGQNISTEYYANGYVKRITDNTLGTRTDYEYDNNGNRTYESYQRTIAGVTEYLQNATVRYDELNRASQVTDTRATIRYEYDAAGNRRRVWSYYNNGIDGAAQTQDNWYAYDGMNRFTVSMGSLSSTDSHRGASATDSSVSITTGAVGGDGIALAYDQAGQRRMIIAARDGHREDYAYSATGYLTDTWINTTGSTTQGSLAARRSNDLLGRVTAYSEYAADGVQTSVRNTVLDADNRTLSVSGTDGSSTYAYYNGLVGGILDDTSNVSSSGAGELAQVTSSNAGTTTNTWTHYDYWDEAKQSAITISAYNPVLEENNALWKPGVSRLTYDANGHLASAADAGKDGVLGTGDDIRFQYIDNAQGLTLRRDQIYGSSVAMSHSYLYLDGKGIGDVGNDGDRHLDYAQSLAQVKQSKTETYKNWQPIASADFDQNYQPINGDNPGGASSRYTVKQGDTLQGVASALWGDASLWYLLADANGLSGGIALKAGQVLTVPNKVTNVHNNSSTFRPYEAGRIIGNTSPTLPDAPPAPVRSSGGDDDDGCGGVGMILVAIVVVVVVIYTAGAAAAAMSEVAAGAAATEGTMAVGAAALGGSYGAAGLAAAAIGGAVGSIAGQGLSMAMGMQKEFSWGAVAAGALGAAAMSGLSGAGLFGGNAVLNAAAGNLATQGINLLTGQQKEFSWASLAASAISAPIAQSLSSSLMSEGGALASFATDKVSKALVSSTVAALVSATTRLAIQGGRLQWEAVAADALSGAVRGAFASEGGGSGSATQQPKDQLARQEAQFDLGAIGGGAARAEEMTRIMGQAGDELAGMNGQPIANMPAAYGGAGSSSARSFISDPYVDGSAKRNGLHWSSGAETYPVSTPSIEERALPLLAVSNGSIQADPGLLSNLGGITGAYFDGRVGFRDAMGMVNGQIGGITNVARDTISGVVNGGVDVGQFLLNLPINGVAAPSDPGYISLPHLPYSGRTGSLGSDVELASALFAPVAGGTISRSGRVGLLADEVVPNSVVRSSNGSFYAENDFGPIISSRQLEGAGPVLDVPSGHYLAKQILEGGSGRALAGHGQLFMDDGVVAVPAGTAITLPRHGISILDKTGRYIESNDWVQLSIAARNNERIANDIEGMTTWLSGAEVPNYTLSAPTGLKIYRNSTSVEDMIQLNKALKPNMGCIDWAACTLKLPY